MKVAMEGRSGWLLPLLWISLCVLFGFAQGKEGAVGVSAFPDDTGLASKDEVGPRSSRHREPSGGDGATSGVYVGEALTILHTLESRQARTARYGKSSGILGTTAYYAKETFFLLFMNRPVHKDPLESQKQHPRLGQPLSKAVSLLERAAKESNADAIYLLAELNFYGNYSHPRNYPEAFRRYHELASMNGNSSAQHMVGFMYATSIGGAVKRDQAKALLYHTFSALGGDTRSEMTVAFRHHTGIGTARNCDEAVFYYQRVAEKAIKYSRSGPPGGRSMLRLGHRLADEEGGVYGEGASASSSGVNAIQGGPSSDSHAAFDDVLEYLDLMSRKGDLKATFSLGRLYYEGSKTMNRNFKQAKSYFMRVAMRYWTRDGKVISGVSPGVERLASKAAGYLGRMYLRGEGVGQSYDKALTWFRRGVANGDFISQNGVGLMYLNGYGLPKDAIKAADFFKASADQDFAPAQVNLGVLFLDQGDVQVATRYFELAARHGHIEAFYYLAEIANRGVGRDRSCSMAAAYYKIVAERAEEIHSPFVSANQAYESGDVEGALTLYMMAAEQGYEVGQANVAFLLDEERSRLPFDLFFPFAQRKTPVLRDPYLALIYWTRSAKQSNIDSMVKIGDYYLKGVGTEADSEKAAACYQAAAEHQQSAQALWNLGWMHENGIGVEQDFHLAKRFYDQALETNEEAYLPVTLSLLKLRLRSFWNTITHGRVKSIQSEPEPAQKWSFREWLNNFLQDDHPYFDEEDEYLEATTEHIPGSDDIYGDLIEDGLIESLIIIGLAGALAFLVFYRQQRQLNRQRGGTQTQQQGNAAGAGAGGGVGAAAAAVDGQGAAPPEQQPEQQRREEDRGLFPQPGDVDFGQWIAGGVGH